MYEAMRQGDIESEVIGHGVGIEHHGSDVLVRLLNWRCVYLFHTCPHTILKMSMRSHTLDL
jgi:hypothetical protein